MEKDTASLLDIAVKAHQNGNLAHADALYQEVLELEPNNPDANYNLGVLRFSENNISASCSYFERAINLEPRTKHFWITYVEALVNSSDFEKATAVFNRAKLEKIDESAITEMWTMLNQASQTSLPSSDDLNSLRVALQEKNFEKANEFAFNLATRHPRNLEILKIYSDILREVGSINEAMRVLRKIVSLTPKDATTLNNLGLTLRELEQFEESKITLDQAIAIAPDDAGAHYNLGLTHGCLLNLYLEIDSYTKAIELKPDFDEAFNNRGLAYFQLGKYAESEKDYKSALAIQPNNVHCLNNLGILYTHLGRSVEAQKTLEKAIEIDSRFSNLYVSLEKALSAQGKKRQATQMWFDAMGQYPESLELALGFGHYQLENGELEEALKNYKRALELEPDDIRALSGLALTLARQGDHQAAKIHFKTVLSLSPNDVDTLTGLGMLHLAENNHNNAMKCFSKTLDTLRNPSMQGSMRARRFTTVSKAKIVHDIEQFKYLSSISLDENEKRFNELAAQYEKFNNDFPWSKDSEITYLREEDQSALSGTYGTLINIEEAHIIDNALNENLNSHKITNDYLSHKFGLTYFDNFLSPEALENLRNYLLKSTIWFEVKTGGYLGAYLNEGLASPLILQIAEELKTTFPRIFRSHQLNQIWAYKYDSSAKSLDSESNGIQVHADFAAVNVNFWVSPDSANLDHNSGGLVVYDVEAPIEWDFHTYNNNVSLIREEIGKTSDKMTKIPYRSNRIVIFNSNLFHETDRYIFKDGYENRRINITMLFGERSNR